MTTLRNVFSPIAINRLTLKNRVVRAAHSTGYAPGAVTDQLIDYHRERARSGVALSILEATPVHRSSALYTVTAWDDDCVPGFARLADAVHEHGMAMFVQLWHGGHRWPDDKGHASFSASAIPSPGSTVPVPIPMSRAMIAEVTDAFAQAALRVQRSGLDGVELQYAHGYLVHQFLSPAINRRTDDYGGDAEGRMRLALEIARAVRAAVGPDFPVGVRVSPQMIANGFDSEDAALLVERLCGERLVDFVSASVGSTQNIPMELGAMHEPPGYMLPIVRPITAAATVPVIVTGRFRALEEAEQVIRDGDADMVSMVRAMIADPDIVAKTLAGESDRVRPCIACNQGCMKGTRGITAVMLCTVNATVGREADYGERLIVPSETPRRVVVVGGGPAGMEAARIAALGGHRVTLLEAQPSLGGALSIARRAPRMPTIGDFALWLEQEVYRLGVDVHLSNYAESDDVLAFEPDHVIVATGSLPRLDGLQTATPGTIVPGVDLPHVRSSHEIFDLPRAALGDSAVVLDDVGHYEAIAVAEHLVDLGLQVSFVTRHISFAPQMEGPARAGPALARLSRGRFEVILRSTLVGIDAEGCDIAAIDGGKVRRVPASTVVLVTYNQPLDALYHALADHPDGPAVTLVGDARSPRDILVAIQEGHFAARAI